MSGAKKYNHPLLPKGKELPPAVARDIEGRFTNRIKSMRKALHKSLKRRRGTPTQSNYFNGVIAVKNPRYNRSSPKEVPSISNNTDQFSFKRTLLKKPTRTSGSYILNAGYNFSSLEMSPKELVDCCVSILMSCVLSAVPPGLAESRIQSAIHDFVVAVQENYSNTAYHSFYHATDVMQSMFFMVQQYFNGRIDERQQFMLLVISLLHDVGHPGGSINILHEKGFFQNYKSLEAFHVSLATELLKETELYQEEILTKQTQEEMLDLLEYLVLATDMSRHEEIIGYAHESNSRTDGPLEKEQLAMLIKLCDVCNVVRKFDDAREWSTKLKAEFSGMAIVGKKGDTSDCSCSLCSILNGNNIWNSLDLCKEQSRLIEEGLNLEQISNDTITFIVALVMPIVEYLKLISQEFYDDLTGRIENNLLEWKMVASEPLLDP